MITCAIYYLSAPHHSMTLLIPLTERDVGTIESRAAGLSKEEVLATYYRTYDELGKDEIALFEKAYARGRALAKFLAVDMLFRQMQGKDGVKGALSYLVRFGDDWPAIEDERTKGGEHSFKVVFPHMKK
jgi:hypothetical protein